MVSKEGAFLIAESSTALLLEAGRSSHRTRIAELLGGIFQQYNLGDYPSGNTYQGKFPEAPMTILTSHSNERYTRELITALKHYMTGTVNYQTDYTSDEAVKLCIYGEPTFRVDGTVKIN